jgi:Na+/serine symporter
MYGWIVQIYGYSPGAAKVWEKVSSVSSAADVNVPFASPIRCGLSSSFFQVTVVPGVTVRLAGRKVKLSILTVAALAAAVGATLPAAVSLGRATAKSEATPAAPNKRATRWRNGA